jgi:hypothetical protein
MTYTTAVCTVKNSWWWTEELSETCRVSFQNKLEKLVHLVGFIIRICHDARSHEHNLTSWATNIFTKTECSTGYLVKKQYLACLSTPLPSFLLGGPLHTTAASAYPKRNPHIVLPTACRKIITSLPQTIKTPTWEPPPPPTWLLRVRKCACSLLV